MGILKEVLELIDRKALEKAMEYAYNEKIIRGEYPSMEKILEMKGKYYDSYLSELKYEIQNALFVEEVKKELNKGDDEHGK